MLNTFCLPEENTYTNRNNAVSVSSVVCQAGLSETSLHSLLLPLVTGIPKTRKVRHLAVGEKIAPIACPGSDLSSNSCFVFSYSSSYY